MNSDHIPDTMPTPVASEVTAQQVGIYAADAAPLAADADVLLPAVEVEVEVELEEVEVLAPAPAPAPTRTLATNAPTLAEDDLGDADDAQDNEVPALPPLNYVNNFEIGTNPLGPLKGTKWDEEAVTLHFRSADPARTDAAWYNNPVQDIDKTEPGRIWKQSLERSFWTMPRNNWFARTALDKDAFFRQTVKADKQELGISAPRIDSGSNGEMLTGQRAVIHMRAMMNMGNLRRIGLWHSGFWVTVQAPSDGRILELERRISDEKVELGRATHGLAYANQSSFLAGLILEFAIEHITMSSLKEDNPDYLKKIKITDIPLLIQGMAAVIWPNGFQYARAVLNSTKVIQGTVDVVKLLFKNNRAFTAWQIGHMAGKNGRNMTEADLERYQSEFTKGKNRVIQINDNVALNLHIPTIEQYLTCGEKWVNNIVLATDNAFGISADEGTRNSYINSQGKATNMRQFAHWVDSIQAGQYLYTAKDVETQEMLLDTLSSNDNARRSYFEEIQKYIEDVTVSIVAIPAAAEDDTEGLNPQFPNLLPIDTMACFFILLVQEANKIRRRM